MSAEDNELSASSADTQALPEKRVSNWETKVRCVEKYLLLGNLRVISEQEGVKYDTLIDWKKSDWWKQLADEIRAARTSKKANKLSDIVNTSLEAIEDRLKNGDYVLNVKTGKIERRKVSLRDLNALTNNMLARQLQLEEFADKVEQRTESSEQIMASLAKEFAKMVKKTTASEVIDVVPKGEENA